MFLLYNSLSLSLSLSLFLSLSLSLSLSDVHISFGLQWLNGTVLKLSWSISPLLSAIIKDDTAFVVEWRKRNNKTLPLSSSSSSSSWSSSDVLWSITEHKVQYYHTIMWCGYARADICSWFILSCQFFPEAFTSICYCSTHMGTKMPFIFAL